MSKTNNMTNNECFICPVCLDDNLITINHAVAPVCVQCSSQICDECYIKCPVQNMCFVCKTPLFIEDRQNDTKYRWHYNDSDDHDSDEHDSDEHINDFINVNDDVINMQRAIENSYIGEGQC